jgi:hypothetical protein
VEQYVPETLDIHLVVDNCASGCVEGYNPQAEPFAWTVTADSILAKIKPLCQLFPGSQH